eukprot:1184404-Prorocentrum_minimum.AAC.1
MALVPRQHPFVCAGLQSFFYDSHKLGSVTGSPAATLSLLIIDKITSHISKIDICEDLQPPDEHDNSRCAARRAMTYHAVSCLYPMC